MNKNLPRRLTNIAAVIVTLLVNGLANALPLNGQTTGAISDRFKVYFVPAGYVFSIWGLIYIGLIAFAVYQAMPAQRSNPRLDRIGYLFAASCLANCAWIFLWHYEYFPLTLIAMATLLFSLIAIYLRLDICRAVVSSAEKWLVDIPFSIYLGWITVATIANVSDVLYLIKWDGWGLSAETWMVIMLIVATALAASVSITRGDIAYMLVIVWAFIGIAIKQTGNILVGNTTLIMTGIVVLMMFVSVWVHRNRRARNTAPL